MYASFLGICALCISSFCTGLQQTGFFNGLIWEEHPREVGEPAFAGAWWPRGLEVGPSPGGSGAARTSGLTDAAAASYGVLKFMLSEKESPREKRIRE
jgi:hypothetical protein